MLPDRPRNHPCNCRAEVELRTPMRGRTGRGCVTTPGREIHKALCPVAKAASSTR